MRRIFSCSSSQVAVERWNRRDQKLLEAVQRGDVGRVAALASRKSARPSKLDSNGQSPFHLAASKGLTECLTLLLANGADVNSKNEDGSTALHLATISCQPQCVKVLLQHGANEDAVDAENRSPLHWAASSGCASSVLLLCDHEAFLDVPDDDGRTPLMIASLGGHAAICSQLLQRGARVNVTDKADKSALILACEKGSAEVAELLLSHGADAGAVDSTGRDALHYALHTQDKSLWSLLQQALNRRRGGQGLVQPPDLASQASASEPQAGSSPKTPWRAEPEEEQEEEEDEDSCSEGWRWTFEEEHRKVSRLEQELVQKTEECKTEAAACLGLENQIQEQAQELGLLLSREPGASGGQGSSPRPGGDGMEQGRPLDLLAERIQELKKQQQAAATVKSVLAPEEAEDSAPGETQYEVPGRSQPEERGPPQSPGSESIRKAAGQQLTTDDGQTLGPDHAAQERPQVPGVEPGGTVAEPAGAAAMNQLLLQLREELAAAWREKDAARAALSGPAMEGALGTPRAEAAAAAWEKMEARLERVLARLDRAQAGLQVQPEVPAQESGEGARRAAPGSTTEDEEKEKGAPGARGGAQALGGLEREVWALRLTTGDFLEELGELGRERAPRPEAQVQLQQRVGLLTEELAAEKAATEELRACIGALAERHRQAQHALARLRDENRQLRASLCPRGDTGFPAPAAPHVAALEQDLGKLEEELRAVQAAVGGKRQEVAKLKRLLHQATEEVAELRAREAAQAQARRPEPAALLERYQAARREARDMRGRSEQCEQTAERLAGACRDKEAKVSRRGSPGSTGESLGASGSVRT
ncbi:Ankyrin repeat domain-containing protein 35 [Plecturocebus cupreus]